jgi:hypothetical protein
VVRLFSRPFPVEFGRLFAVMKPLVRLDGCFTHVLLISCYSGLCDSVAHMVTSSSFLMITACVLACVLPPSTELPRQVLIKCHVGCRAAALYGWGIWWGGLLSRPFQIKNGHLFAVVRPLVCCELVFHCLQQRDCCILSQCKRRIGIAAPSSGRGVVLPPYWGGSRRYVGALV